MQKHSYIGLGGPQRKHFDRAGGGWTVRRKLGSDCAVVAPSLIPRTPCERVKTGRFSIRSPSQ